MKKPLIAFAALALTTGPAFAAGPKDGAKPAGKDKTAAATVMCPVMKSKVIDTKNAKFSVYKGKKYYFCCASCKPDFDKNPAKFVKVAAPAKPAKPAKPGAKPKNS